MNDRNRYYKGFTLAELLIVVAIIGVLVAISIPVFMSQLEKSREAVDIANARAMYAEVMAAALTEDSGAKYDGATIHQADGTYMAICEPLTQQANGWATKVDEMSIGGVPSSDWIGQPSVDGSCTILYNPADNSVKISWDGIPHAGTDVSTDDSPNVLIARGIGEQIRTLEHDKYLSENGTHIWAYISSDGTISITVKGKKANTTPETILHDLEEIGAVTNGKVALQPNDSPTGYTVYIKIDSGNGNDGGKITVTQQ